MIHDEEVRDSVRSEKGVPGTKKSVPGGQTLAETIFSPCSNFTLLVSAREPKSFVVFLMIIGEHVLPSLDSSTSWYGLLYQHRKCSYSSNTSRSYNHLLRISYRYGSMVYDSHTMASPACPFVPWYALLATLAETHCGKLLF
jgi:hypothetical protein